MGSREEAGCVHSEWRPACGAAGARPRGAYPLLAIAALVLGACSPRLGAPCSFSPPTADGRCKPRFDPSSVDAATWQSYSPAPCPPSPSPLFQAGPNDVFEFELQADFDVINDPSITVANQHLAASPGTLRYHDAATGQLVQIPVTVEARGVSRFTHCAFRPLTIVFAAPQVGNVFQGLSRKVKVATHCGNHPSNPWILGGTPEVQRRRLLAEYYFYQTLEALGSTALATRASRITYRSAGGSEIVTEYAFLREREDDACKRCGWVDEAEPTDVLTPNALSVFQAEMYNKFVYNNDYAPISGHNTIRCKSAGMTGFYIPYDWDLTGVVRPDYFKNNGIDYRANADAFFGWLDGTAPTVRTQVQAWHIASHRSQMRGVLRHTLLDPEGEDLLQGWFDLYLTVLECWLGIDCKPCSITSGCERRGAVSLLADDFEGDTVGAPPVTGVQTQGSAIVVDSTALGSRALRLARNSATATEALAPATGPGGTPQTSGIVFVDYRAHGEAVPPYLIAGPLIAVTAANGSALFSLKLYDGAYHLLEGGSALRLAGAYDPSAPHRVHTEINLIRKRFKICIDGTLACAEKPLPGTAPTVKDLRFSLPQTITEAFPATYVVDDVRITK